MASRPIILEVERKFSRLAVQNLTINQGNPPFQSLRYLGKRLIRDTYYDSNHLLSSKGIWIRKRNGHWEAKLKRGGDFQNSKFEEIFDAKEISHHLRRLTGIHRPGEANFGLQEMASFTTLRQSWAADEEFTIVQDVMDFDNHVVGEVELQCALDMEGQSPLMLEEQRASKLAEMDLRIAKFMDCYSWAFHIGAPKGKLAAFLERG